MSETITLFVSIKKLLKKVPYLVAAKKSTWLFVNRIKWRVFDKRTNRVEYSSFGPIIINVNDKFISKSIVDDGYWAIQDIDLIRKLIDVQLNETKVLTFYDVGANIGTHSLALSKIFKSRIKIRAFEAQRPIYNMLCGTMALNSANNVFCHLNAVSSKGGEFINIELPDYTKPNNFGGFELMPPRHSDNESMSRGDAVESVETLCLDSFNEPVQFIKMDIEGMEDKALLGCSNIIEKFRPICFIEILKTDSDFVIKFFEDRNYTFLKRRGDALFIPLEYESQVRSIEKFHEYFG